MNNQLTRERAEFGQWSATVTADFYRRVRENPQIAIDLLVSLVALRDHFDKSSYDGAFALANAAIAAATTTTHPDLVRAAAHYTEQARQAAERNREEVLPEHRA